MLVKKKWEANLSLPDLQVCLLCWLLSLHMVLEWQLSHLEQEHSWWMEGYVLYTHMPTYIIHEEQKLNTASSKSAELCTQSGSCCQGWMAAWAGDAAAPLQAAASCRGWGQHSNDCVCEHPLSADSEGRWSGAAMCLPHSCWSPSDCCPPKAACARAATCLSVPQICFLFYFFPSCINLVNINLIASFSDRLSQKQCKWALKCGDLAYICQLIAQVAQTSRDGTCLLALRSTFDFRPNVTYRRWPPDEGRGSAHWAISCSRWWRPKFL